MTLKSGNKEGVLRGSFSIPEAGSIIKRICASREAMSVFQKYTGNREHYRGSCLAIARSLERILGGKLYGVGYYKNFGPSISTEHFVVRCGTWLVDGSGAHNFQRATKHTKEIPYMDEPYFKVYKYTSGREDLEVGAFYCGDVFEEEVFSLITRGFQHEIASSGRQSLCDGS